MRDKKPDILNEPNMGVEQARGVLARLFRQILLDEKFNPIKWSDHMERYLNDPRNGVPRNVKDRSTARGNLNKELRQPTMTWKVFYDKALRFLNPLRVRFVVQVQWQDGHWTDHPLGINMSDDYSPEELMPGDDPHAE